MKKKDSSPSNKKTANNLPNRIPSPYTKDLLKRSNEAIKKLNKLRDSE